MFFVIGFLLTSVGVAQAMTPTLYLSSTTGDNVNVLVVGDANSSAVLYYTTNYGTQNRTIGTTNSAGLFSTVISTNSYDITSGSSVYVMVNNQQSISSVWPYVSSSYNSYNSLALNQNNVSLTVGQTSTITTSSYIYGSLYVSTNTNSGVATTYASGNNITIYGVSNGTTTLTICQTSNANSCGTVYVTVGGYNYTSSNSLSSGFSVSALNLSVGNSATITSTAGNGLYVSTNSNPRIVSVSYNASYVPGCTPTSNYSITTGQPCNGSGTNSGGYYSSIPGCTASTNYSPITGQSCAGGSVLGQYANSNNNTSAVISGLARGSTALTLCQNNSNNICTTISITVQ